MTIEIVSLGNELLSGRTENTNASWIARQLQKNGFTVSGITTLPDDTDCLRKKLLDMKASRRIIIITGGLGPTLDDVTRGVLADVFKTPLIFHQELENDLIKRFGKSFDKLYSFKDQSTLPKGAIVIPNSIGTASGFILKDHETAMIALPGVPTQMKPMLLDSVVPFLNETIPQTIKEEALFLCQLTEMQVDPYLCELKNEFPSINIGICPSYGVLSIYLTGKERGGDLSAVKEKLEKKFSTHLFSYTSKSIEQAVHIALANKKKSLALAESCTGGSLAARLTAISGASNIFLGSVVSYSDHVKTSVLGVDSITLKECGAVSKEVAVQMVKGVLKVSGADYGLAVTGIAGPDGGSHKKPVGTVWGALGTKEGKVFVGRFQAKGVGSRESVIEYIGKFMLSALWRYLTHDIPPFDYET